MTHQLRAYDRPIEITEGVFWVGYSEKETNFHCNPYLMIAGKDGVLLDGGSRPDFSVVMTKILQTGFDPRRITRLVYHHYDPDLCGSISHFLEMCDNPEIKILSHPANNIFIPYYISSEQHRFIASIEDDGNLLEIGDRRLRFIPTPYCHAPGSFVTFDEKTGTLFSSDLFGSFSSAWDLFVTFDDQCFVCTDFTSCPIGKKYCAMADLVAFQRQTMTCCKALRYAMQAIEHLDIEYILPQHGSIIKGRKDVERIIKKMRDLDKVGIDGIV